jgi:Fe-S-cluster-containing hydrogenase component 2
MILDKHNYHPRGLLQSFISLVRKSLWKGVSHSFKNLTNNQLALMEAGQDSLLTFNGKPHDCKECQVCEQVCPTHCLEYKDERTLLFKELDCIQCSLCVDFCKDNVLSLSRSTGVLTTTKPVNLFR